MSEATHPFELSLTRLIDATPEKVYRCWTEADQKAHEEMGFHEGWGKATDQLAAVAAGL